jgi:UDP-N-acetylglucosamine 2-epimerase (non-hydrolysing)
MKIITIVSTRPCLIRQSLIIKKLDKFFGKSHIFIYTGQNYDKNLYNIFLKDLKLRKPDYEFNLDEKLSNYQFIGKCMVNIEKILQTFNPKNTTINILGDVNGAFASAYVAKRMGFKIVHNESGNRCGEDILEEINRKNIDSMSYKLLCYSQRSRENLLIENYSPNKIIVSGNPLGEVVNEYFDKNREPIRKDKYILVTLHRYETINDYNRLQTITNVFKQLANTYKIILSLHPSLADKLRNNKTIKQMFKHKNVELTKPFNYTQFLNLMKYSVIIMSDSGGECEEACLLGVPCLVLRNETERIELLEYSQMILCGTNNIDNILQSVNIIKNLSLEGVPEEYTKPTSNIVIKNLINI